MYCIGTPGQEPRLYIQTPDVLDVIAQVKQGEIIIPNLPNRPVEAIPRSKIVGSEEPGYTLEPLVDSLTTMQAWFWEQAKNLRQIIINGGFMATVGAVDSDEVSISRVTTVATVAISDPDFSNDWTMADNSQVSLGSAELIQLHKELTMFITQVQNASVEIRAQIDAATSQTQLEALDLLAGYPDSSLTIQELRSKYNGN